MPSWSGILKELSDTAPEAGLRDFDTVRRTYLDRLYRLTGRNLILYASGWLQKEGASPGSVSIAEDDVQALMEVTYGLEGARLDLILHSPGGSPEAAEAIVSYLRSRFSDIRVIVPHLAMSAATMLACAADEIVLGKHSFLGPTDPQLPLQTPLGVRMVPAQAVLDQFDRAQRECADPSRLAAWLPLLSQYGPDLLAQCESALSLSKELVRSWLQEYMFKNDHDAPQHAERIAAWLAGHGNFNSHGRHIPRANLECQGLKIYRLENNQDFQDLSLSVFHATTHTFNGTPTTKIIENHMGRAFIKQHAVQAIPGIEIGIAPGGPGGIPGPVR